MAGLPMPLPRCKQHGEMVLRPLAIQTPEQRFCGVWYDCPRCYSTHLYASPELEAQLAEQRAESTSAS